GGSGTAVVMGMPLPFCGSSLAQGARCVLSIRFSGMATGTANLTLNTSSAFTSTAVRPLQGSATARALVTISENDGFFGCTDNTCSPAGFGGVASGGTQTQKFL